MSQQHPLVQVGQAGYGHSYRSPVSQGQTNQSGRHQDPSSILSVYPFMTYAPTARVAQHLSPHHAFPQNAPPSSEVYPQYAEAFNRVQQPQTAEDWALRQSTDIQIQQLLERQRGVYDYVQGVENSISGAPIAPSLMANSMIVHNSKQSFERFVDNTLSRSMEQQLAQPVAHPQAYAKPQPQHHSPPPMVPQSHPQPFVPPHSHPHPYPHPGSQFHSLLQTQAQPFPQQQCFFSSQPSVVQQQQPNGGSVTLPLAPGVSPAKRPSIPSTAMRSPHPTSSIASTPTADRIMSSPSLSSSPDPLCLPGPSPSKKPRGKKEVSPIWTQSNNYPADGVMGMGSLSMAERSANVSAGLSSDVETKHKIMLKIPIHLATPQDPPRSNQDEDEEEEDKLEWADEFGEDEQGDWTMERYSSPGGNRDTDTQVQMSGRTGERDTRTAWQKLHILLEDILEESDAFPANPTFGDLKSANAKYFSHISKDGTHALLSTKTMSKIIRYIIRVQSTKKRQKGAPETDGESRRWDLAAVNGLLRHLEKCIRDAEGTSAFPEDRKAAIVDETGKKKKGKSKTGSVSPLKPVNAFKSEGQDLEEEIPQTRMATCHEALLRLRRGVAAAECCFVLLDSEGLTRQVYSEDLLSTCVQMVKEQLAQVIVPILQGMAGEKIASSTLAHVVQGELANFEKEKLSMPLSPYFHNVTISAIAQSICSTLPRLTSMVSRESFAFSESLIIQIVYLAKEPLFVVDPGAKKKSEKEGMAIVKTLRMEALSLLRGAFARYEGQRQWIIEEILSSLVGIPGQSHDQTHFQLANGKSIHALSALLLQLVQASAYGAIAKIRKLHSSAADMEVLDKAAEGKRDVEEEEARICAETVESAVRSATMVASYILSKATTTKATKTSLDADYKTILSLFMDDLLTVLYRPEWPAASLYLSVFSRIMVTSLDDAKTGNEATASKTVALDYLADIAAKLKTLGIEMAGVTRVSTLDENLIEAQTSIRAFLNSAAHDDSSLACSLDMASVIWAQELQTGVKKARSVVENLAAEKDDEAQEMSQKLLSIGMMLKTTLRDIWMVDDKLFEVNDPKQAEQAVQASISVSRGRSLQSAIDPIIHALLTALGNPIIAVRTKALRGVGSIVMVDPDVLRLRQFRLALEERLLDVSPGVRDAAVELVGKYLVQKPELATQYYPHIALRVMDTGLSVRRRVIKILKGIFATMEEKKMQIDICCKMIALTDDSDPGVKDLSTKTLTEMIFSDEGGDSATLLVDILSDYKGSYAVLEKAMNEVLKQCENVGRKFRFGKTIDDLVARLIDATEQIEFDSLSHVKAICLIAGSDPSQVDTRKASVLLTYLRPPANADDQATNELLLRIFQRCIPRMPRTASTFALDLTKSLMPMISKPSGGFQALRETIGCFCAVTNYLTKDWMKVIAVLKACEAKIRPIWRQSKSLPSGKIPALSQASAMMLYITALIAEGFVNRELRRITAQPISEYFSLIYLDFARMHSAQSAPTICLGALFRSYPSLLQQPEIVQWMQDTFISGDMDARARLLGVIHEFLASEVRKRMEGVDTKKDVSLLIGNAKELQDSDYSTTIVQNNIEHIFDCAKSQHAPAQNAALDVLTFVVNQGLYSPVHTVPILVTLETAEDPIVSERALALHNTLHAKHANLIHVLFMDSAKASYQYQRSISAEPSGHRNGVALLSKWYAMLHEKRSWRHDFLKALCRAFDGDLEDQMDIGLVLYLAENLATLDYKLQEEPMTVVQALNRVVSTCSHLAALMEEAILEGESTESLEGKKVPLGKLSGESIDASRLADASIVVGLALLVKNHLVALYHLPEDKCASHIPGKKSTVGDKPAQRRGMQMLELSRMPLARGVVNIGDFKEQQIAFSRLLQEDGTLSEKEEL
ncbi:cohesin loading factor subunit SCC2 [Cryptococcus deuterogattii LA55]|nr:cohesin loading factor subunit SCC2 [Cryptococcus deuterogattii LA55]KIR94951.1 cohesin loading factor subunit SCC2 [Cryptococcus deuterogattii CBS 10090]